MSCSYLLAAAHSNPERGTLHHVAGAFCLATCRLQGAAQREFSSVYFRRGRGSPWKGERKGNLSVSFALFTYFLIFRFFNVFQVTSWVFGTAWGTRFCVLWYDVSSKFRNGTRNQDIRAQNRSQDKGPRLPK